MDFLISHYCTLYKEIYFFNKTPLDKLRNVTEILIWFNNAKNHVLENWKDIFTDANNLELNFTIGFCNDLKLELVEILSKINFNDKFDFSAIIYKIVKFENSINELLSLKSLERDNISPISWGARGDSSFPETLSPQLSPRNNNVPNFNNNSPDFNILKIMFLKYITLQTGSIPLLLNGAVPQQLGSITLRSSDTVPLRSTDNIPQQLNGVVPKKILFSCFEPYLHHFFNYEKNNLNTYIDELVIDKSNIPPSGYPIECVIPFLIKVKKSYSIIPFYDNKYLEPVMEKFVDKIIITYTNKKINVDESYFPILLNTIEYILDAINKMKLNNSYVKNIYTSYIKLFVNKNINQCNINLRRIKWIINEIPGDNSDYIEDIINNYSNICKKVDNYSSNVFDEIIYSYHTSLCEKIFNDILNINQINNLGCQQLLVDIVSLKKEFELIYEDRLIDIVKVEDLIKVIQSSDTEILNVYLALIENRSYDNLYRILTMKSVTNKKEILNKYQEMNNQTTNNNNIRSIISNSYGNIKNIVNLNSLRTNLSTNLKNI